MTKLILASSSPRRLTLLKQLGYEPVHIHPAEIDETPHNGELPKKLAERLAKEKAEKVSQEFPKDVVIAGDTVVCVGRRILPKALTEEEARYCMEMLSGRRHRVYSGVCVRKDGVSKTKVGVSMVKFKNLSKGEISLFINTRQWHGMSGGYMIQGIVAAFVKWFSGTDTNIMGLPLFETYHLLSSFGINPSLDLLGN